MEKLTEVIEVFWTSATKDKECFVAAILNEIGQEIARFGCKDCNYKSYLSKLGNYRLLAESMKEMPIVLDLEGRS